MDPHGDLQRQRAREGLPSAGERFQAPNGAMAVHHRSPRQGGRADRGRLQRARARGRAAEGGTRLRKAAAAALALLSVLAPAAPAPAKQLAPGVSSTKVVRAEGPLRYHVLSVDRSRARLG